MQIKVNQHVCPEQIVTKKPTESPTQDKKLESAIQKKPVSKDTVNVQEMKQGKTPIISIFETEGNCPPDSKMPWGCVKPPDQEPPPIIPTPPPDADPPPPPQPPFGSDPDQDHPIP